jgi:tRNA threonylcarbamoyladenosine biosynthesis protein TsaE
VQAVAAALGVDRTLVASPTFVLIHEYLGSRPIFHFDAYRLKDEDEFSALAPDEYFEAGGLCFVEWADRVRDCLPGDYLEIVIEPTGEQSRTFTISSHGERLKPVITALMADKLGKI